MKKILFFIIISPLFGFSLELKVSNFNSIQVIDVPIPVEQLNKDLSSGLSTKLVATINFWNNNVLEFSKSLQVIVFYNLWDEIYSFQVIDAEKSTLLKFQKKEKVINLLKEFHFNFSNFPEELKKNSDVKVSFALVIDPISNQKRSAIRKWLAQNQVGSVTDKAAQNQVGSVTDKAAQNLKGILVGETRAVVANGSSTKTIGNYLFSQVLDAELGEDISSGKWIFVSPKVEIQKVINKNEK